MVYILLFPFIFPLLFPLFVAVVSFGLLVAAIVTRITGSPSTWILWFLFPVVSFLGTHILICELLTAMFEE